MAIVEFKNVTRVYITVDHELKALDNVSFELSRNMWLTLTAVILGLPGGALMLDIIVKAFGTEYELNAQLIALSCIISSALTFAVSLAVAAALARQNRKINMVEALKNEELKKARRSIIESRALIFI